MFGCCDMKFNKEVSKSPSMEIWHAFSRECENRSAFNTLRYFEFFHTAESVEFDFVAQNCIVKGNVEFTIEMWSFSLKQSMWFDMDDNVEVPAWAFSLERCFSLTFESELIAVVNTSRDFDFNVAFFFNHSSSTTRGAWCFNNGSLPAAPVTGCYLCEHAKSSSL